VKTKRGKETAYEAKTVRLAGRRYIVSRTHQDAEKDPLTGSRSWRR
jgi:hypothetical protein